MNKPACATMEQPQIRPYTLSLSSGARAALKHQQPCCLWLTGLSGAGKSTLANLLELRLNELGLHTFVLDGDNVRTGLCRDLGMDAQARKENIRRMSEVARLMVEAGLVVIVSAISPFRVERDAARALFATGQFFEVYISTPFDTCAQRDPKGLYKAAREGRIKNFTGLDSPYEAPLQAECEIDTASMALPEAIRCLLQLLQR
ncbi:adenylyl-sulfate kinase [Pseudomonas sessilinigenes]|uniref:Adenylyl-sulfate kinase n=1 Tax=Pseudomonas sessilinigenes TaxID=658629 RepID=A0ABX8MRQ8_9PSED|nr:adenylyl-sulfate kinase [Pseudomonas sessilinigenes]AZC22229.1 Adenylylsulfate kinase [Pseudomonas sessilinigenes]QXH41318.1 adenylyl-sulfate kinase [Pseudomonas sessilinigenes]